MQLTKRCYAVTGLGYSAPWFVNAGFITGDEWTLVVDTGGNRQGAQTIHGYATAAKPRNRLRVINTEKHFDHIGGNGFFRELGVEIWGHRGITRTEAEFQAEIAGYNGHIPNTTRRAKGEAGVFFYGTKLTNPDQILLEDSGFDLGGCQARIVMTPGHTNTNVSVWMSEERVLYTGDCLISEYLPNLDAGVIDDWKIWLESLKKVEALDPQVVVPGHGPVARGGEVGKIIARVREVLTEALMRGVSPTG